MDQIIITKIKHYACKDWSVLDAIIGHSIKILSVSLRCKNGGGVEGKSPQALFQKLGKML